MSYDISLYVEVAGLKEPRLEVAKVGNYTYNCGPMFRDAGGGKGLSEFNGASCASAAGPLRNIYETLRANPEKYRAMNPENGWGDYDTFLQYIGEFVVAVEENPAAYIEVS